MANQTVMVDLASAAGQTWEFIPEGAAEWKAIRVPEGGWRAQGYTCDAGVYRTWLEIPKSATGQSVQLYFEAINFGCQISLGKDEASAIEIMRHVAPWVPVIVDITKYVKAGEKYLLVVKVLGRNKYLHERVSMQYDHATGGFVPGKLKQWMVPQAAAWQDGIAEGIIRGARMLILPAVHLSEPYIVTSVAGDTINPYVKVNNIGEKPLAGVIRAKLSCATGQSFKYPAMREIPFTINEQETRRFDLTATVWGLGRESYWWANVPYQTGFRSVLHNLELEVVVDGKVQHRIVQRFGFREFTWKGNRYYLNGIICNLRGDNQQEANFGTDGYGLHPGFGKPTKKNAGWAGAVDNLQRLNFNVMRIHQVPPTQYMLDVCDEMGLMIVDETPIRNSEQMEDWVGGWDNMIATVRELALRDRNHPCVVIWSAANEIWSNRPLSLALQGAIWSVDWTRPIIIDGINDVGPEVINMQHYVGGLGVFPEQGGTPRQDRPYGETESIWPMDNDIKGFVWMATSTRHRRLQGNADIRNYVFNNAWPNYVPGHGRDQQFLEKAIKKINWAGVTSGDEILPDIKEPWKNEHLINIQKCYNPCTACDVVFDRENRLSNDKGEWPVVKPKLRPNQMAKRVIAIFNDTFAGEVLEFTWQVNAGKKKIAGGSAEIIVPLGEFVKRPIMFTTPASGELRLSLRVSKGGKVIFEDDSVVYQVA